MGTSRDPAPLRVVVAEDDAEMRRLLVHALRKDGYEVTEARDGYELVGAIDAALLSSDARLPPDLVITDVRMPGWTGMEVLRGLREAGIATQIIVVTAFGDSATHRTARELGACAVLDKPFELDELRSLVRDRLAR